MEMYKKYHRVPESDTIMTDITDTNDLNADLNDSDPIIPSCVNSSHGLNYVNPHWSLSRQDSHFDGLVFRFQEIFASMGYVNQGICIGFMTLSHFVYNVIYNVGVNPLYRQTLTHHNLCNVFMYNIPFDMSSIVYGCLYLLSIGLSYRKSFFTAEDIHNITIIYIISLVCLRNMFSMFFIYFITGISMSQMTIWKWLDIGVYTVLYIIYLRKDPKHYKFIKTEQFPDITNISDLVTYTYTAAMIAINGYVIMVYISQNQLFKNMYDSFEFIDNCSVLFLQSLTICIALSFSLSLRLKYRLQLQRDHDKLSTVQTYIQTSTYLYRFRCFLIALFDILAPFATMFSLLCFTITAVIAIVHDNNTSDLTYIYLFIFGGFFAVVNVAIYICVLLFEVVYFYSKYIMSSTEKYVHVLPRMTVWLIGCYTISLGFGFGLVIAYEMNLQISKMRIFMSCINVVTIGILVAVLLRYLHSTI